MILTRLTFLFIIISIVSNPVWSQVTDTIANWDGINVEWTIIVPESEVVTNPEQQGINTSLTCLEITTGENPYDFIFTVLWDRRIHPSVFWDPPLQSSSWYPGRGTPSYCQW